MVAGLLVLPALSIGGAEPFAGLGWDAHGDDGAGLVLEIVAGVAAVVVMTYAGAVLARPRSIPYWNSPLVPGQFLVSSCLMSMGVVMALQVFAGEPVSAGQMLLFAVLGAGLLVLLVAHLVTNTAAPGKSHSLERLLRGRHRRSFVGGVIVGATAVPAVAGFVAVWWSDARDVVAIGGGVLVLVGGYCLRLITLRVGIFPPVHIPRVTGRARSAAQRGW